MKQFTPDESCPMNQLQTDSSDTRTGQVPVWPVIRSYDEHHLDNISLPVGGIGTGTIGLGGRGDLREFEIGNRPTKGFRPGTAFFALRIMRAGSSAVARVLEGPRVQTISKVHPARPRRITVCPGSPAPRSTPPIRLVRFTSRIPSFPRSGCAASIRLCLGISTPATGLSLPTPSMWRTRSTRPSRCRLQAYSRISSDRTAQNRQSVPTRTPWFRRENSPASRCRHPSWTGTPRHTDRWCCRRVCPEFG